MKNINAFLGGRKYLWFFFISLLVLFNSCKKEPLTPYGVISSKKNKLGVKLSDGQIINNFEELQAYIKIHGITDEINDKYFYFNKDHIFSSVNWPGKVLGYQMDTRDFPSDREFLEILLPTESPTQMAKDPNLEVTIYGISKPSDIDWLKPYYNPYTAGGNPQNPPGDPNQGGGGPGPETPTSNPGPKKPTKTTTEPDHDKNFKPKEYAVDEHGKVYAWREVGTQDWIAFDQLNEVTIRAFNDDSYKKINLVGLLVTNNIPNISGGGGDGGANDCDCNCSNNENELINMSLSYEPKWGQLTNLAGIKNEVNKAISLISNFNNITIEQKLKAISDYFEANRMFERNVEGKLIDKSDSKKIDRYIYTESNGWMDMHHFFYAAFLAENQSPTYAALFTSSAEYIQSLLSKQQNSAYSYEDLPSNLAGINFWKQYGKALGDGTIDFNAALTNYFKPLSPKEPEQAPNYDYIPHIIDNNVPKNYSPTGLTGEALKKAAKESYCKRSE